MVKKQKLSPLEYINWKMKDTPIGLYFLQAKNIPTYNRLP
jgi:hypothetical protein